jgi:TRAP-type C4-dicarboxylate transport system permease small subunit
MLNFLLKAASRYVRVIGAINDYVGIVAMYVLFVMMGILGYAVYSNVVVKSPAIWAMEMAQFSMAAYYLLGGGYTLKDGSHVRMDVLYHRFGPRGRAILDSVTGVALLFYLAVLVFGGVESTIYSLEYNQKNFTAWAPPMAPIKIIMTTGMALMLAQGLAIWFQDLARAWGKELPAA